MFKRSVFVEECDASKKRVKQSEVDRLEKRWPVVLERLELEARLALALLKEDRKHDIEWCLRYEKGDPVLKESDLDDCLPQIQKWAAENEWTMITTQETEWRTDDEDEEETAEYLTSEWHINFG